MIFLWFAHLHVVQKGKQAKCIDKLNSCDEILSSLIKKACGTCTFLNHFREANEQ